MTESPTGPGMGPGWTRLALELKTAVPSGEIDRIWAFKVVRREGRDFGTAILSRSTGTAVAFTPRDSRSR